MSDNHLEIKIPDEVLDERKETDKKLNEQKKQARKRFVQEILKTICALHNSNGGTLKLSSSGKYRLNQDIAVRLAEEGSRNVFNISEIYENFKIHDQTTDSLTLRIQRSSSLVTMKLNIFFPTETQVLEYLPVKDQWIFLQLMNRKFCKPNENEVPVDFISKDFSGLKESDTVQLKNLTTKVTTNVTTKVTTEVTTEVTTKVTTEVTTKVTTKVTTEVTTTFADRVIENKFTRYVSAFANHRGGQIYYGIKDDGVVAGEKISDEEKVRVENRIKDEIGEMRCHGHGASGSSGVEWDVTFAPVKKKNGTIIESTFVMIVSIKPFFGGVFTEEPESYHIKKGEVVKIKFDDWLVCFKMEKQPWAIEVITSVQSHVQWRSQRNRKIYLDFTIALVQCRNDNDMEKFYLFRELAKTDTYKTTDASLIVSLENVAVHYKKHEFEAASKLLEHLERTKEESRDPEFHFAKMMYLKSRIKRAQGEYKESYDIAIHCLKTVANLTPDLITVWYYMQLAMLANILGARGKDSAKFSEARSWLQRALNHACRLNEYPTGLLDVQQKLFIYRAMTLLKCSLIGEISNLYVSPEEISAAAQEVTKVHSSLMNGGHMSQYREIQHLFAQCSLFIRHSEHTNSNQTQKRHQLNRAQRWAKQAEDLASDCGFEDMQVYATSFQAIVDRRCRN